jgi:hypothetical protein
MSTNPRNNTHCTATLLKGESWATAKLTGEFSGTPSGVLFMLFEQMAQRDLDVAKNALDELNLIFREFQEDALMSPAPVLHTAAAA